MKTQKEKLQEGIENLIASHGSVAVMAALSDQFSRNAVNTSVERNKSLFKQQARLFLRLAVKLETICHLTIQQVYGDTILSTRSQNRS